MDVLSQIFKIIEKKHDVDKKNIKVSSMMNTSVTF